MVRGTIRAICLTVFMALPGCGTAKLETGYQPRKIGESHVVRRSYYTSPFSPEGRAADSEREQDSAPRRATPGY